MTSSAPLRAGSETLGDLDAHLDDAFRLRQGERLRIGIGDDEVATDQPGGDHVVDGVSTGAADAEDGDPRLELPNVRSRQVDGHGCLSSYAARSRRVRPVRRRPME
jgi:hypothetical protein